MPSNCSTVFGCRSGDLCVRTDSLSVCQFVHGSAGRYRSISIRAASLIAYLILSRSGFVAMTSKTRDITKRIPLIMRDYPGGRLRGCIFGHQWTKASRHQGSFPVRNSAIVGNRASKYEMSEVIQKLLDTAVTVCGGAGPGFRIPINGNSHCRS